MTNLVVSHSELENFESSIVVLRITSPPQPTLFLSKSVIDILARVVQPARNCGPSSIQIRLSLDTLAVLESTIKSARGIDYSKPLGKKENQPVVTVGSKEPGVEFNQRVLLYPALTKSLVDASLRRIKLHQDKGMPLRGRGICWPGCASYLIVDSSGRIRYIVPRSL